MTFLCLLVGVLAAEDVYFARALRRDYLRAGFEQLDSIARLAESRPPDWLNSQALASWTAWMARSGARVTAVTSEGLVLADSSEDPGRMENHADRPEIRAAFRRGRGQAVRYSETLHREQVYLAVRHRQEKGEAVVLRFAWPLAQINEDLAELRWRFWSASLVILLIAGVVALFFSRAFSERVGRLKEFSRRVAGGDFRPLPAERRGDELTELTHSLNQTAGQLDRTIQALKAERNQSEAIFASMTEGVAVITRHERILFANHAFCRSLNMDLGICQNRALIEVIRQSDLLAVIRRALSGQERIRGEVLLGETSFAVAAAPILTEKGKGEDENGGVPGAVLVLHDISELRRLEHIRRDFVANVSHEFKTPLTSIQGFAETLLDGAIDEKENRRRFLEIIRDHSIQLSQLTEYLLKLATIEAGKLELATQEVDVGPMMEACLETTRLRAREKNLPGATQHRVGQYRPAAR